MKKVILALILVFALSAPALAADVLIERYENANKYQTGPNTYRLEMGGPISNAEPFDIDGPMVPQTYNWSDVVEIAPNVYRAFKGKFGYTVFKNTGEIRIHPVRKRWDVYYSVAPKNPISLSHRQVNDKLLELYVDTSQIRYSFFIGDRGFKINNRLKANFTGGNEWSYTYDVSMQGLTRQGRKVLFNGTAVGNLPDPFMIDSAGTILPVQESLNGGELTITATGLDAVTLPVAIDPTLGPVNPDLNNVTFRNLATTSQPNAPFWKGVWPTATEQFALFKWDFSATPMESITSSTFSAEYYAKNQTPENRTLAMSRLTQTFTSAATYNTYDGSNNWAAFPNGVDFTTTGQATQTIPVSFGTVTWDMTALAQDALNSRGSILWHTSRVTVPSGTNHQASFHGLGALAAEDRPQLTIDFIVTTTTNHAIKPWCKGVNYENRPCLPFGSLFPN